MITFRSCRIYSKGSNISILDTMRFDSIKTLIFTLRIHSYIFCMIINLIIRIFLLNLSMNTLRAERISSNLQKRGKSVDVKELKENKGKSRYQKNQKLRLYRSYDVRVTCAVGFYSKLCLCFVWNNDVSLYDTQLTTIFIQLTKPHI